jgi:hypothetical protein
MKINDIHFLNEKGVLVSRTADGVSYILLDYFLMNYRSYPHNLSLIIEKIDSIILKGIDLKNEMEIFNDAGKVVYDNQNCHFITYGNDPGSISFSIPTDEFNQILRKWYDFIVEK